MHDDFAFVPNNGPPRLIRYVDSSVMPSSSVVSMLDSKNNLLFINNHLFEQLDKQTQEMVLRTKHRFLEFNF